MLLLSCQFSPATLDRKGSSWPQTVSVGRSAGLSGQVKVDVQNAVGGLKAQYTAADITVLRFRLMREDQEFFLYNSATAPVLFSDIPVGPVTVKLMAFRGGTPINRDTTGDGAPDEVTATATVVAGGTAIADLTLYLGNTFPVTEFGTVVTTVEVEDGTDIDFLIPSLTAVITVSSSGPSVAPSVIPTPMPNPSSPGSNLPIVCDNSTSPYALALGDIDVQSETAVDADGDSAAGMFVRLVQDFQADCSGNLYKLSLLLGGDTSSFGMSVGEKDVVFRVSLYEHNEGGGTVMPVANGSSYVDAETTLITPNCCLKQYVNVTFPSAPLITAGRHYSIALDVVKSCTNVEASCFQYLFWYGKPGSGGGAQTDLDFTGGGVPSTRVKDYAFKIYVNQ